MKTLILTLALATSLNASWITPKGKTYHTHRDCIALRSTAKPVELSDKQAVAKGLTLCGICNRRKPKGAK